MAKRPFFLVLSLVNVSFKDAHDIIRHVPAFVYFESCKKYYSHNNFIK